MAELNEEQLALVHRLGKHVMDMSLLVTLDMQVCGHLAVGMIVQQVLACGARHPEWLDQFRKMDEMADTTLDDDIACVFADDEIMQALPILG